MAKSAMEGGRTGPTYSFMIEQAGSDESSLEGSEGATEMGFQRDASPGNESLAEAQLLAREKFEWLTSRAIVARARHDRHDYHYHDRGGHSSREFEEDPMQENFERMGAAPTPYSDRRMASPGAYGSAAKYLSACARYSLQPNGGALLGLSLGLQMLEVDGSLTNLELVPLCAALLDAPFIQHLKLSGHALQDTGAAVLALALPGCNWITELELVGCQITGVGVRLICASIPKSGVQRLVLRGNLLRQNSAVANVALAEVVEHARALTSLDLQSCGLRAVGMRMIKQALSDRVGRGYAHCAVDFEGNFVLVEVLNSVTHGVCALICVEAWRRIHQLAVRLCQLEDRLSVTLFISSMMVMFTGSTLYHSMFAVTDLTWFFKMIDHCAIYVLIAGTYTPILVLGCRDVGTMLVKTGTYPIVFVYWAVVTFGIIMEHIFSPRTPPWYSKFILLMYVLLGFGGVPFIATCQLVQSADVMVWIELGGLTYVVGIVFFLLDRRYPAMHVIWHLLVGLAAFFHFVAVWNLAHEVLSDPSRSCVNTGIWSSGTLADVLELGDDASTTLAPIAALAAAAAVEAKQL